MALGIVWEFEGTAGSTRLVPRGLKLLLRSQRTAMRRGKLYSAASNAYSSLECDTRVRMQDLGVALWNCLIPDKLVTALWKDFAYGPPGACYFGTVGSFFGWTGDRLSGSSSSIWCWKVHLNSGFGGAGDCDFERAGRPDIHHRDRCCRCSGRQAQSVYGYVPPRGNRPWLAVKFVLQFPSSL